MIAASGRGYVIVSNLAKQGKMADTSLPMERTRPGKVLPQRQAVPASGPSEPAKEPQSVRQRTYQQLKGLILSGRLRPAERLAESTLAKRFGVSRTPLREALMKLEEGGLVVGERNVGYSVAAFDVAGVCDLLRVREALDVCAAELACHRATEEDLARIAAILEQMAALNETAGSFPSDLARKLELGIYIHKVIAEATRNESLLRVSEQIYQQLQLALWLEVLWIDLDGSDLDEHRAIAEAIIARDPSAAAAAAREHVQSSLRNMLKLEELMKHRRGLIRA